MGIQRLRPDPGAIYYEFDALYQRLPENGVCFKDQLVLHRSQLLLPNCVGDGDNKSAFF